MGPASASAPESLGGGVCAGYGCLLLVRLRKKLASEGRKVDTYGEVRLCCCRTPRGPSEPRTHFPHCLAAVVVWVRWLGRCWAGSAMRWWRASSSSRSSASASGVWPPHHCARLP